MAGPISIQSDIRQGCQLSTVLYALCLQPFLRSLVETVPRIRIGQRKRYAPVIAYAEDVMVFVIQPAAFTQIQQALRRYELVTGASLKPQTSKALAVGTWKELATILGIEFHDRVNILGVTFGPTIAPAMKESWTSVMCTVRAQARKSYSRNLCLAQRIHYIQLYLLAKRLVPFANLPPTHAHAQQLKTICSWFLWLGATFRFPLTTFQRPKDEGGWNFPNYEI